METGCKIVSVLFYGLLFLIQISLSLVMPALIP